MKKIITVSELLGARVHCGCKKRLWNPKMSVFVYGVCGGYLYFDAVLISLSLFFACRHLEHESKNEKRFLFIGTRKVAARIVVREARRCGASYLTSRWRSGTLTNWEICRSRIAYFNALNLLKKGGKMRFCSTKKEAARFERVRKKLKRGLGGLRNMIRIPDCVIVVDPTHEGKAVAECVKLKIPIIAIIDGNGDPSLIDIPIPANVETSSSLGLILNCLSNAILAGRLE
jgi:small subunit ribosomal protein S2